MTQKGTRVGLWLAAKAIDSQSISLISPRAELPAALPEGEAMGNVVTDGTLGDPLSIRDVARLIGCSVWTVRHQCLKQGLPHVRLSRAGRLIFYRNQVVRWLFVKQTERRW